jgi:hypothetical protein
MIYRNSTFNQTQAILYTLTNELIAKMPASLFPPLPEKALQNGPGAFRQEICRNG